MVSIKSTSSEMIEGELFQEFSHTASCALMVSFSTKQAAVALQLMQHLAGRLVLIMITINKTQIWIYCHILCSIGSSCSSLRYFVLSSQTLFPPF